MNKTLHTAPTLDHRVKYIVRFEDGKYVVFRAERHWFDPVWRVMRHTGEPFATLDQAIVRAEERAGRVVA